MAKEEPIPDTKQKCLEELIDVLWAVSDKAEELEKLYRRRDALYVAAQSYGATIAEISKNAGVGTQAVKYMLGRAKKGR